MTPVMLRQFWDLIETTQSQILLNLDDSTLVYWLVKQMKERRSLECNDVDTVDRYIRTRLPLIRDLAQSRGI